MKRALTTSSRNGQNGPLGTPLRPELPPSTLRYLAASLKQRWKRYRKELKRCQSKFSERAVHQSRVETRRLGSLLALLSPFLDPARSQKAHLCLKQHLDTFDDLRDTQVQLSAVKKMRRAFPAARPFYEHLLKREARLTRRTRKEIKRIKTKQLGKLLIACREEIKTWWGRSSPVKANAMLVGSINKTFMRTLDLKNRINPKAPETIHRTRVAFKRLRYMIETLADYFPIANEKLLKSMHEYQTMMGDIQDAEVVRCSVDRFFQKKNIDLADARRWKRELLARRQMLIRVYLSAADQLIRFWPDPRTKPKKSQAPLPVRSRRPASAPGPGLVPAGPNPQLK